MESAIAQTELALGLYTLVMCGLAVGFIAWAINQ
jgi:hypothetical protein